MVFKKLYRDMFIADFAGTVVGDQIVCTSGAKNLTNYYCKLFENTNNDGIQWIQK